MDSERSTDAGGNKFTAACVDHNNADGRQTASSSDHVVEAQVPDRTRPCRKTADDEHNVNNISGTIPSVHQPCHDMFVCSETSPECAGDDICLKLEPDDDDDDGIEHFEAIETEVIEDETFNYADESTMVYLGEKIVPVEFCTDISIKSEEEEEEEENVSNSVAERDAEGNDSCPIAKGGNGEQDGDSALVEERLRMLYENICDGATIDAAGNTCVTKSIGVSEIDELKKDCFIVLRRCDEQATDVEKPSDACGVEGGSASNCRFYKKNRTSKMWSYFTQKGKYSVHCNICSNMLSTKSRSNLMRHLRHVHSILVKTNIVPHNRKSISGVDDNSKSRVERAGIESQRQISVEIETQKQNDVVLKTVDSATDRFTDVDTNQPWRFFTIGAEKAKCSLCFQYIPYKSVDDISLLISHLRVTHAVQFERKDCAGDASLCANNGDNNIDYVTETSKVWKYFKELNSGAAMCNFCLKTIPSRNRPIKTLTSHLYIEHSSKFAQTYSSLQDFSKSLFSDHLCFKAKSDDSKIGSNKVKFKAAQKKPPETSPTKPLSIPAGPPTIPAGSPTIPAGPPTIPAGPPTIPLSIPAGRKTGRTWSNFTKIERGQAQCNACRKVFTYTGGSVDILTKHLKESHCADDATSLIAKRNSEIGRNRDSELKTDSVEDITIAYNEENLDNKEQRRKASNKLAVEDITIAYKEENLYNEENLDNKEQRRKSSNKLAVEDITIAYKEENLYNKEQRRKSSNKLAVEDITIAYNEENLDNKEQRRKSSNKLAVRSGNNGQIWEYFSKLKQNNRVMCRMCFAKLSIEIGGTSEMVRHLRTSHRLKDLFLEEVEESVEDDIEVDDTNVDPDFQVDSDGSRSISSVKGSPPKKPRLSSQDNIWLHYVKLDGKKARCKFCSNYLVYNGRISHLKRHLVCKHSTEVLRNDLMSDDDDDDDECVQLPEKDVSARSTKSISESERISSGDLVEGSERLLQNINVEDYIANSEKHEMWSYFEKKENKKAECKICFKQFAYTNNSITYLSRHIWEAHIKNLIRSETLQPLKFTCEKLVSKSKHYFWRPQNNRSTAKCKICLKWFSVKGNSTGNLIRHLRLKHFEYYNGNNELLLSEETDAENLPTSKSDSGKPVDRNGLRKNAIELPINKMQCKVCSEEFSDGDFKTFRKHVLRKHMDKHLSNRKPVDKSAIYDRMKKIQKLRKKMAIRRAKCNLCSKTILLGSTSTDRLLGHLLRTHRNDISDSFGQNIIRSELTVDDDMNVIIKCKPDFQNTNGKNDKVWSYFTKLGMIKTRNKCNICHKFVSSKIHCSHKIPYFYSLTHGLKSNSLLDRSSVGLSGMKSVQAPSKVNDTWYYFSTLNQYKSWCEICSKALINRESFLHEFACRCNNADAVLCRLWAECNRDEDKSNTVEIKAEQTQTPLYLQKLLKEEKMNSIIMYFYEYFDKLRCNMCSGNVPIKKSSVGTYFEHLYGRHTDSSNDRCQLLRRLNLKNYESGRTVENAKGIVHKIGSNRLRRTYTESGDGASELLNGKNDVTNGNGSEDIKTVHADSRLIVQRMFRSQGRRSRKKSRVWLHFKDMGGGKANCNYCRFNLSYSGGALNNLLRHLRVRHANCLPETMRMKVKDGQNVVAKKPHKPRRRSETWNHFTRHENDWAQCNICLKFLSFRCGTIHNLTRHLRSFHKCETFISKDNYTVAEQLRYKEDLNLQRLEFQVTDPNAKPLEKEIVNKTKRKSPVWTYFTDDPDGRPKCNLCLRSFAYNGKSSNNLSRHLRTRHNIWFVTIPNCSLLLNGKDSVAENDAGECFDKAAEHREDGTGIRMIGQTVESVDCLLEEEEESNNEEDAGDCGAEEGAIIYSGQKSPEGDAEKTVQSALMALTEAANADVVFAPADDDPRSQVYESEIGTLIRSAAVGTETGDGDSSEHIQYEIIETTECSEEQSDNDNKEQVTYYILPDGATVESTDIIEEPASHTDSELISNIIKSISCADATIDGSQETDVLEKITLLKQIKKDRRSIAWDYFEKLGTDRATCNICSAVLSFKCKAVHNLTRHLYKIHPDLFKTVANGAQTANDSCVIFIKEDAEDLRYHQYPDTPTIVVGPPKRSANYQKAKTSYVWNHFVAVTRDSASCNLCGRVLSHKGGASNNLMRHLRSKHGFTKPLIRRKGKTQSTTEEYSEVIEQMEDVTT